MSARYYLSVDFFTWHLVYKKFAFYVILTAKAKLYL